MKTHMLTRVRRLWANPLVPREVNRRNQRAWIRSVRLLGDRWLGATTWTREDWARIRPKEAAK